MPCDCRVFVPRAIVSLCVFGGLLGVLEGLVGLWLWFGVVGECLTEDSQHFKCLGGVETVLSLGV